MISGRKYHVLVVDNSEDVVRTMTAMLERLDYAAEGETDTLAGLRTFSQDPDKFDIAIVEPTMAGQERPELAPLGSMRRGAPVTNELTGMELARRFRRIREGFPVILYTGYNEPVLAEEIRTAGFAQIIPKPLELKELDKAVREGLHSYFPRDH
jgi:CheY-like chemotaxis protein